MLTYKGTKKENLKVTISLYSNMTQYVSLEWNVDGLYLTHRYPYPLTQTCLDWYTITLPLLYMDSLASMFQLCFSIYLNLTGA